MRTFREAGRTANVRVVLFVTIAFMMIADPAGSII